MILSGVTGGIPGQADETFIPLTTQVASGTVLIPRCSAEGDLDMTANSFYTYPMVIYGTHTITALSCRVKGVGTGSTVVRIGLFNNDPTTGRPGTLLVDAGTASATSTGIKTITGLSTAVTPGIYWPTAGFQTVTGSPLIQAGWGFSIGPLSDQPGFMQGQYTVYVQGSVSGELSSSYAFTSSSDQRGPIVGITVL